MPRKLSGVAMRLCVVSELVALLVQSESKSRPT